MYNVSANSCTTVLVGDCSLREDKKWASGRTKDDVEKNSRRMFVVKLSLSKKGDAEEDGIETFELLVGTD